MMKRDTDDARSATDGLARDKVRLVQMVDYNKRICCEKI